MHNLLNHRWWGRAPMLSLILISILFSGIFAQQPDTAKGLDQLNFLLGDWIGEGGGNSPGQGSGGFTFSHDLQNTIIVRRNFAEYPATDNKPASRHDDLMIIYKAPGDTLRAIYFDNEGHVINYFVNVSAESKSAVFTSPSVEKEARFRLSYALSGENSVNINFELAPPGQPDAFSTYISASAHRK
jgi:hypothetical protein